MILWNFINLVDAEGGWFITIFALFAGALLITKVIQLLFEKGDRSCVEKGLYWQSAFFRALFRPLVALLWFYVSIYCLNLVTDYLFSEQLPRQFHLFKELICLLLVSWFFFRWKKYAVLAMLSGKKIKDKGFVYALNKLGSVFLTIMTLLIGLEVMDQSIHTLLAFGGISGLALAFAAQDVIANFFGGFVIHLTRPFSVGDKIIVPNHKITGEVEDIGWYRSKICDEEKRPLFAPNALFIKAQCINITRQKEVRLKETISLRHEDMKHVPKIIEGVRLFLEKKEEVTKPEVLLVALGPYSIDIQIKAQCKREHFKEFKGLLLEEVYAQIKKVHADFAQLPL